MKDNNNMSEKLNRLYNRLYEFNQFHKAAVPLCAAENVISDFCKIPLNGDLQERYIMGSHYSYDLDDNFIGSQYLLPIYSMIHELCLSLFGAKYSDARTLSGMNCLTTVLMSLTSPGDKIAILSSDWGGHSSVSLVCERLGLKVYNLPYCREIFDLDYPESNRLLNNENIPFILLAPSDVLRPFSIEHLDTNGRELLYDVSQIMGLIAGGAIECPLRYNDNAVIFGGTHKTLPGPTSGLILTNSESIQKRLEHNINPNYLRNTQMHQVAGVLFALLEMEQFGGDYASAIVNTSNQLGSVLEREEFALGRVGSRYSETHQIFIYCEADEMSLLNNNSIRFGVTLNKKTKPLFDNTGIRLGTQEIARYGWGTEALETIGLIFNEIRKPNPNAVRICALKNTLPPKKLKYTFSNEVLNMFQGLHQK